MSETPLHEMKPGHTYEVPVTISRTLVSEGTVVIIIPDDADPDDMEIIVMDLVEENAEPNGMRLVRSEMEFDHVGHGTDLGA